MAKHSETIEIKQEVSKIIICLGVGIVLVSVAYLLSWDSRSLWPSLHVAGVVTGLYLVALLVYAMRPPMKRSVRIVVWCSMLVLIGISGFVWTAHKDRVEWQYRTILQIRQVIARGLLATEGPKLLMKTLEAYYAQGKTKPATLGETFRMQNPGAILGGNLHKSDWEGDSVRVYLQELQDDRIVLLARDSFVAGRDSLFRNVDGRVGKIQEMFTLTIHGVTHESQN